MTYRINNVNAYNGWDPLKQVVLGNVPLPDFFDGMPDKKLASLLQKILEETIEDLDNIEGTLKEHGVDVIRLPHGALLLHKNIKDYIAANQIIKGPVPKPPITPRDYFITLGKKVMRTMDIGGGKRGELEGLLDPALCESNILDEFRMRIQATHSGAPYDMEMGPRAGPFIPSRELIEEKQNEKQLPLKYNPDWFNPSDPIPWRFRDINHKDYDPNFTKIMKYSWMFWAPQITRVGDTLIYDTKDITNLDKIIPQLFPEFKKSTVTIGGHDDSTFCLPKPGLVVCAPWYNEEGFTPEKTFPGWDILILDVKKGNNLSSDFRGYKDWTFQKHLTGGKWWHPEIKEHPELVHYVSKWLNEWVGFAEETFFEVNMLSISPECILSMNYQEDVHKKLKKHGIEPIYCRFRHRNFWDGGLHCLTLDTLREGEQQNYGL